MGKRRSKATDQLEPIETELRLAGDPEVLQAVFASSIMALEAGTEEKVSDLESRYFDTPDLDLRARGLAFRVRANGAGFRQTLKAGDDSNAVILQRDEWETPLDDAHPKPEALPAGARDHLPKAAFKDGLEQAFTTRVQRRTRKLTLPDATKIEAALDLGEIETSAGVLPIAELELELLEGPPGALYRLALELQEHSPLRLETRSKSARAFDRLTNRPPSWNRGGTPLLDASDTVEDAMAAIFESCFQQWLANQAAAIDGRDPEGVHQMRVALRRLRSAFSVFRRLIPEDQLVWLQADAKAAIRALGPARDWDVFQADLLSPVIEARPDDPDLKVLRTRARAKGRAGYRQARRHLEHQAYTRFVLRFGEWLEQHAWRKSDDAEQATRLARPITGFAGRLLEKRQNSGLAKGRHFARLPAEKRHELRIALKKLRYTVEFFKPLFAKGRVKPFLSRVKAMQEDLGHLNDVAVAESLLADLLVRSGKQDQSLRTASGLVIGWHARGLAAIEPQLRRDWKAFEDTPSFW